MKRKKGLLFALTLLLFALPFAVKQSAAPAYGASAGFYEENGKTYYRDANGNKVCNATPVIDGKKYWFTADGSMRTGWMKLTDWIMYFDEKTGAASINKSEINGKKFLFNKDGVCYTYSRTEMVGGKKYWFNQGGELRVGWSNLGNWTMYFWPDEWYAATGFQEIAGKKYLFNPDGVLYKSATPVVDGKKYWAQSDGALRTGWMTLTDWIMYFNPGTYTASVGRTEVNGHKYLFNKDGVCYTYSRTEVVDGKKYWFNQGGELRTGWCTLGNWKMYFWPDIWCAATGWQHIDGVDYEFDSNGVLIGGGNTPAEPTPKPTPTPTPTPPKPTPTPQPTPTPVPELKITLNKTALTIDGGKTERLTYTTNYATDAAVDWTVANAEIADVWPNGTVEARSEGETDVTVTIGNAKATCHIVVKDVVEYYCDKTMGEEIFDLINDYRSENGLHTYTWEENFCYQASKIRAADNVTTEEYDLAWHGAGQIGVSIDIRRGATEAFERWKNSPMHNSNMLDADENVQTAACAVAVKVVNNQPNAVSVIYTVGGTEEIMNNIDYETWLREMELSIIIPYAEGEKYLDANVYPDR